MGGVFSVTLWYRLATMKRADQRKPSTFRLEPDVAALLDHREGDFSSMSANSLVNIALRRLLRGPILDDEVEKVARRLAKRDARILEALKNL